MSRPGEIAVWGTCVQRSKISMGVQFFIVGFGDEASRCSEAVQRYDGYPWRVLVVAGFQSFIFEWRGSKVPVRSFFEDNEACQMARVVLPDVVPRFRHGMWRR